MFNSDNKVLAKNRQDELNASGVKANLSKQGEDNWRVSYTTSENLYLGQNQVTVVDVLNIEEFNTKVHQVGLINMLETSLSGNSDNSFLEGGSDGANRGGELNGRQGFEKTMNAIDYAGKAISFAAPYTGPLAPEVGAIGRTVSLTADGLRTIADIDEKGFTEGALNGGIRTLAAGINYGIDKLVPTGSTGMTNLDNLTKATIDLISSEATSGITK